MKESRYRTKRDFADRLALSFADPIELESRSNSKKNPEHEKAKCFLPGTFFFRTMGKPGLTDTNRLIAYFSWAAEEGKNKSGWKRNDENATHAVAIAAVLRFLSFSVFRFRILAEEKKWQTFTFSARAYIPSYQIAFPAQAFIRVVYTEKDLP